MSELQPSGPSLNPERFGYKSRPEILAEQFKEVRDMIIVLSSRGLSDLEDQERSSYYKNIVAFESLFEDTIKDKGRGYEVLGSLGQLNSCADWSKDFPFDNEFVRLGINITERILPEAERALGRGLERYDVSEKEVTRLYFDLVRRGDPNQQMKGVDGLSSHLDWIVQQLKTESGCSLYLAYAKEMLALGSFEQVSVVLEKLEVEANEAMSDNDIRFARIVSMLCDSEQGRMVGLDLSLSFLEKHGLPSSDVLKAWIVSDEETSFHRAVFKNIQNIITIEKEKSGVCKFLCHEFGIADFGRYPAELLISQFEEYDDRTKPYGVILFPRTDHNGAFYSAIDKFRSLYQELKGEFLLRVAECDGKIDVARRLIALDRKYNPEDSTGHKISLLILGGHGSKWGIEFGGKDDRHKLVIPDLMGSGVKRTSQFFIPHPTIILSSCSTGAEGAIGQKLSLSLGAKVIAPAVPTNLAEIQVSRREEDGTFQFNATYSISEAKNIYAEGKRE